MTGSHGNTKPWQEGFSVNTQYTSLMIASSRPDTKVNYNKDDESRNTETREDDNFAVLWRNVYRPRHTHHLVTYRCTPESNVIYFLIGWKIIQHKTL